MPQREPVGAEALLRLASASPILQHTGRCTRLRGCSSCSACRIACPKRLPLKSPAMIIDASAAEECIRCGACVSACPTQALMLPERQYTRWVGTITELSSQDDPDAKLVVACALTGGEDAGISVGCLRSWDASLILHAWASGINRVELRCGDCADCAAGQSDGLFAWMGHLESIADSLGNGLHVGRTEAPTAARPPEAVVAGDIDRRAFFSSLRFRAVDVIAASLPVRMEGTADGEEGAGSASVRRQVAAQAMRELVARHLGAEVHGGTAFESPGVTSALGPARSDGGTCNACSDCVRFCPVGALRIREKDGELRLSLAADVCVGCGLCVSLCRFGALAMRNRGVKAFNRERRITIRRSIAATCVDCGVVFGTEPDSDLKARSRCPLCANRRGRQRGWY